jgi:hypothetical protein
MLTSAARTPSSTSSTASYVEAAAIQHQQFTEKIDVVFGAELLDELTFGFQGYRSIAESFFAASNSTVS